jgi:hypothetical protein
VQSAQDSLVNSIQKQIDEQRRERQNAETEQNIADKEARLAYLKADSSGANALEIAKLEKELAKDKQSYEDTIVDQ